MKISNFFGAVFLFTLSTCGTGPSGRGTTVTPSTVHQASISPVLHDFIAPKGEQTLLCKTIKTPENSVSVGTTCKTEKGFFFTRVAHEWEPNRSWPKEKMLGWKDVATGLTWFDHISSILPHSEPSSPTTWTVEKYCAERGLRLPSGWPKSMNGYKGKYFTVPDYDSEYEQVYAHGIDELFSNMGPLNNIPWFWSSSFNPDADYYYSRVLSDVYIFHGGVRIGSPISSWASRHNASGRGRCVR